MWYKDAVIYQLHVRSFLDSNRDGIGDFLGLTEKLEYLHELGVTALWLLPFYPSPLKDDGYDIADYKNVNPIYGTLDDCKAFIDKAHSLGLKVITELVINHTSDQHPWFQRARRSPPGSPERDFYVWSDTEDHYQDARIIFKDFEISNWTWDPVARAYFWHRFYSHQPDLNFDNPAVHEAVFDVLDFWFSLGVDGLRLDAVPYLYEREGTSCENLKETHDFLKKLRAYVDSRYQDKMLIAEANQWPEDTVPYFGEGKECHMCFHFPLMPRMFMALEMEDRFPIIDILGQTPEIPGNCQWAIFLRNHDELTLEMVTEEERDYMWRVFASESKAKINLGIRRRLAALLRNNRRKIEFLNGLLFSLPGTPVIYYGDEIGMGDNIYLGDRNGVRTPMQWSADKNAGFSKANPQQLFSPLVIDHEFHFEAVNVETQDENPNSLLWWMKRILAVRQGSSALCRGKLRMLHPENPKVLCFLRESTDETVLVAANTSRNVQFVRIMLPEFQGYTPIEMFGRQSFPVITQEGLTLSFGPHQFYWFSLRKTVEDVDVTRTIPTIRLQLDAQRQHALLNSRKLEQVLPAFLASRPWFHDLLSNIREVDVFEVHPIQKTGLTWQLYFVFCEVHYYEGETRSFAIPLALTFDSKAVLEYEKNKEHIVAFAVCEGNTEKGVLADGLSSAEFRKCLLKLLLGKISHGRRAPEILYNSDSPINLSPKEMLALEGTLAGSEIEHRYGHATIVYEDKLVIKIFRRVEGNLSPEVEVGRHFLRSERRCSVPKLHGSLSLISPGWPDITFGIAQSYVPNKRNLRDYSLDVFSRFFEAALTTNVQSQPELENQTLLLLGPYIPDVRLLAARVAEIHQSLGDSTEYPEFAPEPPDEQYRRSLFQLVRQKLARVCNDMRKELVNFSEATAAELTQVLTNEQNFVRAIKRIIHDRELGALRTRVHGDLRSRNVLYTGKDFVITNFEGDPVESVSVRRLKRSPIFDVTYLLRSLDLTAEEKLFGDGMRSEDRARLVPWLHMLEHIQKREFLKVYASALATTGFVPESKPALTLLYNCHYAEHLLDELLIPTLDEAAIYSRVRTLNRVVKEARTAAEESEGPATSGTPAP